MLVATQRRDQALARAAAALWPAAVASAVGGYALAWSWSDVLARIGNAVFWASTAAIAVAAVVEAGSSPVVRRWLLVCATVAAVIAASALWSIAPAETIRGAVVFSAVLLIAALAGAQLRRDVAADTRLVSALAWLTPGALALCAVIAAVGWADPARVEGPGASGFFNGPNALGIFLALTVPFFLGRAREARWSVAGVVVLALASFTVALSGGRTGLVALLLAVTAFGIGRRRAALFARDLVVALAAIALALAWMPAVPALGETIVPVEAEGVNPEGATPPPEVLGGDPVPGQSRWSALVGARDEAWEEGVRLLDERPLGGHGFATGSHLFDRYESRERFRFFVGAFASGTNVHNSYLELLLELGIVGAVLLLVPFVLALAAAAAILLRGRPGLAEAAFGATLVAAAAAAWFESTLGRFGSLSLLSWMAAGAVVALWLRRRGPQARSD